jgi:Ni/Co efflux regulator RcnB
MRVILIVSAGFVLAASGAAQAQRQGPGTSYAAPGVAMQAPMAAPHRPGPIAARMPIIQTSSRPAPRWGSKIGGRWWGGANAPGGWAGYRRPHRGWAVPPYWNAPRFYVGDWSTYGLPQPPSGYNWVRYYNDAVLIDSRGSVYDTVGGVDWDRPDTRGYGYVAGSSSAEGDWYAPDDAVYAGPEERGTYDRAPRDRGRETGLGGAAIGGIIGGVAGNVIAGRGNRLGGTLIRAGVGGAAGYAIDKTEDRGRHTPPPLPRYGAGYAQPAYDAGYASPPVYAHAPGGRWVSPDGTTTVTTSGGYAGGGTTVVVQSAPVVTTTTTTTDYYETVSYAPRKTWRRGVRRAKPVCNCR